jgi:hypothetical protein
MIAARLPPILLPRRKGAAMVTGTMTQRPPFWAFEHVPEAFDDRIIITMGGAP